MSLKTVHILGVPYKIIERTETEDSLLVECSGYCDWTNREIVIDQNVSSTTHNPLEYKKLTLRHEILHAFFMESGLDSCSCKCDSWATNEEMVDWFAKQGERIYEVWKAADALSGEIV